jgi:hypothetical protein
MSKVIFKNFSEFWCCTKSLTEVNRKIIFDCLPSEQRERIQSSYNNEGWDDLMMRNYVDKCVDNMVQTFGINMICVRSNVIKGKPFIIRKKQWDFFYKMVKEVDKKHKDYVLGGIKITPINKETFIIEAAES